MNYFGIIQWKKLVMKYHVLYYPIRKKCFTYLFKKQKGNHLSTTTEHKLLVVLFHKIISFIFTI